jgi:1,4-dihydroxy-2-naphthoyl-CoA hydrolase
MQMFIAYDLLKEYGMGREAFVEMMERNRKDTALESLSIEYVELSRERVVMRMPVNSKTCQPAGILHGGASVLLAESAASIASNLNIDTTQFAAVGLEINANHVRSKSEGMVTAIATPLHRGRTTMVWDIKITDESSRTICISRCTVAIVKK